MSGVHFDTSQVDRLAADLSEAGYRMQRNAKPVMKRAAQNIKTTMKADASGHGHLPYLDSFVGYDPQGEYGYRIGFAKGGQGDLANIACFGSVNNAPVMDLNHGLRLEAPRMAQMLGRAAEDSVLGGAE